MAGKLAYKMRIAFLASSGNVISMPYLNSPMRVPEIFQELKLVPSVLPKGMATLKICFPGVRSLMGIYTGLVVVPGHQLERLKSEEDKPSPKLPEEGLYIR